MKQKSPKTPKEDKLPQTLKATDSKESPQESNAQSNARNLSKDRRESSQKPAEQSSQHTALAQTTPQVQAAGELQVEESVQGFVIDEVLTTPLTPAHVKESFTSESSAPKNPKQDNSQKPQAQPNAKNTSALQSESASSGDSKQQQSSHTPLDSQRSQVNQNVQVASDEFLQDLEQSAQHIDQIHKAKESTSSKQAQNAQTPQSPKDTPQNPTNTQSTQHIKPEILYRSVAARESVRNFASQLSQEVLNYKPPITKLSLELNPQNLGTLELTISKSGKDLQVQVVSNPSAINLFVNNQVELRNNLAQMGFNNVDLNFSQNGANSGQKHQQGRRNQNQNYQANEGNENSLESHTMFITIPQYA